MAHKSNGCVCIPRYELRSKECIDTVLKPLTDHIDLPINGSLTSKDIFHTTISMVVDKNSIHSITKKYEKIPCETSIRHHLKKLNMDNKNPSCCSNYKQYVYEEVLKETSQFR